jgi:hypothetical protein
MIPVKAASPEPVEPADPGKSSPPGAAIMGMGVIKRRKKAASPAPDPSGAVGGVGSTYLDKRSDAEESEPVDEQEALEASTADASVDDMFGGALDDIKTSSTYMGLPLTMSTSRKPERVERETRETPALTPDDIGGDRVRARALDAIDALDEVSEEVGSTTDKGFLEREEAAGEPKDELSFASDPFASVEAEEPGPFDLRDILAAEKEQISPEVEGSVTRNPLLDKKEEGGDLFGRPEPTRARPMPPLPAGMGGDMERVPTRPGGEPAVPSEAKGEHERDTAESQALTAAQVDADADVHERNTAESDAVPAEQLEQLERARERDEPAGFDAPHGLSQTTRELEPPRSESSEVVEPEPPRQEQPAPAPDEPSPSEVEFDPEIVLGGDTEAPAVGSAIEPTSEPDEEEQHVEEERSELAERLKSKFGKKKLTSRLSAIRAKKETSEVSDVSDEPEGDDPLDLGELLADEESAGIVDDVFEEASRASEASEAEPVAEADDEATAEVSSSEVTVEVSGVAVEDLREGPTAEYASEPQVAAAAAATLAEERNLAQQSKKRGPAPRKLDLSKLAKLKEAGGKGGKEKRRLPRPGKIGEGSSPSRSALSFDLPAKPEERVNSLGGEVSNAYQNLKRGRGHGRRRRAGESQSGLIALPDVRGGMFGDDEPGMASERRGSGYIRLPTSEILEVLGSGTYRILVEDIEYGPVDEKGLTDLIKGGVLLGAEMIAQGDGEWQPIADHPVFRRLRRKMAAEAHAMLAKYNADQKAKEAGPPELPTPVVEEPSHVEASEPEAAPGAGLDLSDSEVLPAFGDVSEPGPEPEPVSAPVDQSGEVELSPEPEPEPEAEEQVAEEPERAQARQRVGTLPMGSITAPSREPEPAAEVASEPDPTPSEADTSQDTAVIDFPAHMSGEISAVTDEEPQAEAEPKAPEHERAAQPSPERVAAPEEPRPAPREPRVDFEITEPSGGSKLPLVLLAILVIGGLIAGGVYLSRQGSEAGGEPGEVVEPTPKDGSEDVADAPDGASVGEAVAEAREAVEGAVIDLGSPSAVMGVARGLMESGDATGAARALGAVWEGDSSDAALGVRYAKALVAAKRFSEARAVSRALMVREAEGAQAVFMEAIKKDQELSGTQALVLEQGEQADAIEVMDTDRAITLKLVKDGAPAFAFKASQAGWEDGWRVDVASWRLCELIGCGFVVPRNRAAKIEEGAFKEMAKGAPAGLVRELRWVSEKGEDGKRRRVLYGALEDWPSEGVSYPIVRTEGWRDWVDVDKDLKLLDAAFADSLSGFSTPSRPELKGEADGVGVRAVGSAMAGVISFDFLTNNWERFVGTKTHVGPGIQLIDGEVVVFDHGTAFAPRASTRVEDRFGWISRFNGGTVAALRVLEKKTVDATLFPDASSAERARLRVFWGQRGKFLRRVDGLIKRYDAARVMPF